MTIVRVIWFVLVPPSGSGRRRSQIAGSGAPGARRRSCVQERRGRLKRSLGTRCVTTKSRMTGRPRATTDESRWAERFCFVCFTVVSFVVVVSSTLTSRCSLCFSLCVCAVFFLYRCVCVCVAGVVRSTLLRVCACGRWCCCCCEMDRARVKE